MAKTSSQSAKNNFSDHGKFKRLLDFTTICAFAINEYGKVVYVNDLASEYVGFKKEDLPDKYFFELFNDTDEARQNEANLLKQKEITDGEFILNSKIGSKRWVLITSKVHRDKSGEIFTYLFLRDISMFRKRENLFAYLNNAATELAKARDTKSALEQISHFIVPKFANWFTIDLLEDGGLKLLLLKHADPKKIKWAYKYRKTYPPDLNSNNGSALVIKTGKPGFVHEVTDEMIDVIISDPVQRRAVHKIGLRSVIIVPMLMKDVITGVVNFISSDPECLFDELDLEFAQNFANLIGLALENVRLNEAAAGEIALRRQSEEQFRFLSDVISHKMWTASPDGRATYYNKGWYDYTGATGFEALKEIIWNTLHPEDRATAALEYPKAIEAGEGMEMEQRLRRYDDEYRWHLTRFNAHKNNAGEILLWVGTSTDIHEQKETHLQIEASNDQLSSTNDELGAVNEELYSSNEELASVNEELATTNEELLEVQANLERTIKENIRLYEQVKKLNEKKDEFIGLASHELKTPLTSIQGYLQIINRMNKDDDAKRFIARTLHQAQKLTALVNDLLDVSKIEAGKLQLSEESFDMRKVVEEAIELIQHTNYKYEIVLEVTLTNCQVKADSQRIEQVLLNLLTNAIKYSPGENRVIVRLHCDESAATVSVTDFGVGIPIEKQSQIFSRFYRVEDTNPNISGLGIGLYISNEIIARHNGKLWVESDFGKGSTFYFSVPLKKD